MIRQSAIRLLFERIMDLKMMGRRALDLELGIAEELRFEPT
jgi:hypothetical protein